MTMSDIFSGKLSSGGIKMTAGAQSRVQVNFNQLIIAIDNLSTIAKSKIATIQAKGSAMSIGDMFDLQMIMNKLSQFSEMSTSIISAMNSAIQAMSRNIKT